MKTIILFIVIMAFPYVYAEAEDVSIPEKYYVKVKVNDLWNTKAIKGKSVYLDVLQIGENLAVVWTTNYKSNHGDYVYYFHQERLGAAYITTSKKKHIPMDELVSLLSKESRNSLEFIHTVIQYGYDEGHIHLSTKNEFEYFYAQVTGNPAQKKSLAKK